MDLQLLVDAVQQLQRPVRKPSVPLFWFNPYRKELRREVASSRCFKVEHACSQRIAEIPSFIHKSLWGICVPIDYESICVNIRWIIHHHKKLIPLLSEA